MEIEDYLSAQRELGQVDSEGIFTVALEKARQKLGKFQLEDPSFYLLKVVQAAVQAGTSRIDLQRTRKSLALSFRLPSSLGTSADVMMALRNPVHAPTGPLLSLAVGFNSALFSTPLQVSLVWWGPNGVGGALQAVGDEVATVAVPPCPGDKPEHSHLYRFSVTKQEPGWFKSSTSGEYAALVQGCCYSPIPIYIDGDLLDAGILPDAVADPWHSEYSGPFHLVERAEPDPVGRLRVALSGTNWRKRGQSGWLRTTRSDDSFCVQPLGPLAAVVRCRNAYTLPLALKGADRIHLVCHGVRTGIVTVNSSGAGASAIMAAEHLEFDVSGFGVLRNKAFYELTEVARQNWRDMAESIVPDLGELHGTVTEKEREANRASNERSCGFSFLGCFGAILIMLGGNLIGPVGGLLGFVSALGGAAFPFLKARPDPHRGLREMLITRLEQLREGWPDGKVSDDEGTG